ncbi:MAG: ribonuclease R family protein, partial [Tepidisphaeraceae bacterium]
VIIGFNLPGEFLEAVKNQARHAVDTFDPNSERAHRFDLSDEVICTIDPDDAKDYDDAISLRRLDGGRVELGVHIADVAHFVPRESALDLEARKRGNSTYFPGHVIPMLPEVLSNGVCSLQEGVPRLCKSVFITYDADAKPVGTKFANTIITSRQRLRYKEAQDIIDSAPAVYHPDGARAIKDYPEEVIELLGEMNALAKRLQKRRRQQGQVVLNLPEVELVLDEEGKVVGTRQEDTSFTHTLIEMFMVEANEAVARLLESVDVPFLRRVHPGPQTDDNERLRHFIQVAGYKLPKVMDRKAIQGILEQVKGKPEEFAINLAILKSLTRAEYSPEPVGHYALASDAYSHYTSPIRRYADLTIHRLLDSYLRAREAAHAEDDGAGTIRRKGRGGRKGMIDPEDIIDYDDLVTLGKQISFTERRSEDAERELRQVKILELLSGRIGELFEGVVTGITNFGIFIQIREYLVDGLIRYEDLMDDWWDVDERSGVIRGQRTGTRIGIGDVCKVIVVRVDVPRRELDLSVREVLGRSGGPGQQLPPPGKAPKKPTTRKKHQEKSHAKRGGEVRGRRGAGGGAKRRGGR